ncbi:multidrug efflux SMR transporter [Arcanobacterium wilhelmae]|uniref:DMT family transporter n=1 Tax=Arcanobacterium wilhelmae TaxID=1803177 RepID=UPI00241510FD|nr:multidrug efflux SMR transporter [Arcanobacterium wilhelmae]WFN89504.1 multidrug efflux SMR transporter [Arcanobacterium wilhelmae]
MAWVILILSGVFEAVWATALGMSHGFTILAPTIVFLVAMAISMVGLGWALKRIPVGTAYAVWTGIGSALTVIYAMASGNEPFSVLKAVFITAIIACVVALKLIKDPVSDKKGHER